MRGFLFIHRCFKVAVRTDPELFSSSIHYLHFLITASFLTFVTFEDDLARAYKDCEKLRYQVDYNKVDSLENRVWKLEKQYEKDQEP